MSNILDLVIDYCLSLVSLFLGIFNLFRGLFRERDVDIQTLDFDPQSRDLANKGCIARPEMKGSAAVFVQNLLSILFFAIHP